MKLLSTLFMLVMAIPSFSQNTRLITAEYGNKYNKVKGEYYVLTSDTTIKHGSWKIYRNDHIVYSGFFKNDKLDSTWLFYSRNGKPIYKKSYAEDVKTGLWEFYDEKGALVLTYDFATSTLNRLQTEESYYTYRYQADNGEWVKEKTDREPIWLSTKYEWITFLNQTLRYPIEAIDKEYQGTVWVDITIDENGNAIDYTVVEGVKPPLDEESIRVAKEFRYQFIPAEKNGKKVKVKIRLPFKYKLERG